jgi:hypothetical protein
MKCPRCNRPVTENFCSKCKLELNDKGEVTLRPPEKGTVVRLWNRSLKFMVAAEVIETYEDGSYEVLLMGPLSFQPFTLSLGGWSADGRYQRVP